MKNNKIREIQLFNQSADQLEEYTADLIPFLTELLLTRYQKDQFIINIVFLSTADITVMNNEYLNHNYETDVITFDFSDEFQVFAGDVFVCPSVAFENALSLNLNKKEELIRVICHGILHLLGFNDKEPEESELMREQEEFCLEIYRTR